VVLLPVGGNLPPVRFRPGKRHGQLCLPPAEPHLRHRRGVRGGGDAHRRPEQRRRSLPFRGDGRRPRVPGRHPGCHVQRQLAPDRPIRQRDLRGRLLRPGQPHAALRGHLD
jgi:hypothetical protein